MRASENARTACLEQAALADRGRFLAQIAPGDLDIAGLSQLPATELALRYHLEPGPLEMIRLQTSFGRRTLIEETLEDPACDPDRTFIGTEDDAELDAIAFAIPAGIFGKLKKQHACDLRGKRAECSLIVLMYDRMRTEVNMAVQGERIAGGFILITVLDGIRYAVRPQSIGIIHDADECRDETLVQLHRGHVVRVPCPLEEVLGWFM